MTRTETYSFGEWLKGRRERLRLTQRELAATVHCSVAMLKKIEADERRPSPELAGLLAIALKVPEPDQVIFVKVARGERPVDLLWHVQDDEATPSIPFLAPVPLPRPATPFIGRTDELKEIGARLAHSDCHLLTLTGPGGAGKTRLALAAAQVQQAAFADGTAFVSLAAITDPNSIPDVLARSLRLTLSGPASEQVLAFLRRRSILLILDNCEQLDGDLGWLSELMANAPGIKLLATSRERLHLAEEWVYVVPELAQAEALFVATAKRVKQDFNIEKERPAVLRICQLVENLPLAVELAASWTPLMNCAQIADHIQRDLNILASDVRNVPDRHRSMQAVFDHSWNLLSSAEQNALMRLSVFRGGWQAEEALPVASADLLVLRRLTDKSLVRVGENGRYDLHELICQYASNKLSQSGHESETRQRHFDAYLALAVYLDAQQLGPDAMAAVARFDQEHDNIRAALGWNLEAAPEAAQTEAALRLLDHLWFYWSRCGFYVEGEQWTNRILDQAGELESVPVVKALSSAVASLYIQGRFSEGESLAERSMGMARRLNDPEALIAAYGTYTFASVNVDQALQGLHTGIALVQETGKMRELLPLLYLGSATWLHSSGRYTEAGEYYRKSIALLRQTGAVDIIAEPLGRLGQLALQEGRLQEAYDLAVESNAAARAVGYNMGFGTWGGINLGLIQLYMGEVDAAQQSLEQALLLFENAPSFDRPRQAALAILSEVALSRGDVKAAADYLQASLDICEKFFRELKATHKLEGTPDALPVDLIGLCSRAALVAAAQGSYERAVTLYSLADSLRSQSKQVMIPPLQARLEETMAAARSHLPEEVIDSAWDKGQHMSLSEAFAFLLA